MLMCKLSPFYNYDEFPGNEFNLTYLIYMINIH